MPTKKEIKVPNHPQIHRVFEVSQDGKLVPTNLFRVRKRVKVAGNWTTRVKTFDSFQDAKAHAKAHFVVNEADGRDDSVFDSILEKFLTHKENERRLSAGTIHGYRNRAFHLKFFSGMEMNQISPSVIDSWINLLLDPEYLKLQHSSRTTYEHEWTLLHGVFQHYREFIDSRFVSPLLKRHRLRACAKSKAKELVKFLRQSEEEQFLRLLESKQTIHDVALLQLHTGVRIGEAAALEFRSIDFQRNEVAIRQHLYWERKKDGKIELRLGTKSGPDRSIPLTPSCRAMLLRRKTSSTSSKVFEKDGNWLSYRTIQAAYDRAFKELELDLSGTHTLRHTFAVRFLDQTKDIYALQRLLGHTDLKVTQVYAKYSNESVRRSFQMFRGGLAEENVTFVPQSVPKI